MPNLSTHYRTQLHHSLSEIGESAWNHLLSKQDAINPFLSYAFLDALHESGSACTATGWSPCFLCLWDAQTLMAAMPLYQKTHSYGEYVFDWAWANAYHQHGLDYYPKLLSAIPFTPVSGNRLLAIDPLSRQALLSALVALQKELHVSSTHILFPTEVEIDDFQKAGFLIRQGVQFHWNNNNYANFDDFLNSLEFKKRKNIRAERKRVRLAGIHFEQLSGDKISMADWSFFKHCYDQTYAEHRSSPYLNLNFFLRIADSMPKNIRLIVAKRGSQAIAASLLIHDENTLFGRYWGCLEQVSCLHFETAYYQAIEFCIKEKIRVFEGGAQGEHKMARGFLPKRTYSAHSLAEPAFSDAVSHFLEREHNGIELYLDELTERSPFKIV